MHADALSQTFAALADPTRVMSTRKDFPWTNSHHIADDLRTGVQSGLPSTRRLELVSAKPFRSGAVAMHYRRAR